MTKKLDKSFPKGAKILIIINFIWVVIGTILSILLFYKGFKSLFFVNSGSSFKSLADLITIAIGFIFSVFGILGFNTGKKLLKLKYSGIKQFAYLILFIGLFFALSGIFLGVGILSFPIFFLINIPLCLYILNSKNLYNIFNK